MLLELRQLSQALQSANVTVGQGDNKLVGYSKNKPLFAILLNEAGCVASIRTVKKDNISELLKLKVSSGGVQESIPGFNIPPLLVAPESDVSFSEDVQKWAKKLGKDKGTESSRQQFLLSLCGRCHPGWPQTANRKIELCLRKACAYLLDALGSGRESEKVTLRPLLELLRRVKSMTLEGFQTGLLDVVKRVLETAPSDADLESLVKLLFRRKKQEPGKDPDAVQIMLELADWTETPANHPSVWQVVNRILVSSHLQASGSAPLEGGTNLLTDVFGEPFSPDSEKMPERRLPQLGNVKLRSHAKTKACQFRYGMAEANSCPAGRETRAQLANSLVWLTATEREGKTFRDISGACGFPFPALLFAFPDPLPPDPAGYADMFASAPDEEQAADQESRFIAAAEGVTKQLQKPSGEVSDAVVKVFALGKRPGDARTKLLVSRQFAAARIIEAAREWQSAAHNIPPIFVLQFGPDKKPQWVPCNRIPSPAQVSRCLNLTWLRDQDGLRTSGLNVFDFGSELTLFLDSGPMLLEITERALRLAVCQWVDLLIRVGQHTTLRLVYRHWFNEQLLLPTILGLLLAKLGCLKEVYMNDVPYWIGRLLAVADRFHLNYCRTVRDGKIPHGPLIGNATVATALENPQAGLARLAERLPLYQQVADEKLRREAAEVTSRIDPAKLRDRASDEEKAQILLGYLARPDLLEPTENNQSPIPQLKQGESP